MLSLAIAGGAIAGPVAPAPTPTWADWIGDWHGKNAGYRGATTNLHVVERFRRSDAGTVHYELTVEDPTTFSRSWTASLDLKKDPRQVQVPEYACHEGNYAMFNILSGARADDRRHP